MNSYRIRWSEIDFGTLSQQLLVFCPAVSKTIVFLSKI